MLLSVLDQINLTPFDKDAPSFLLKLKADQKLDYQAGDWLTVKGKNPSSLVTRLMGMLGLQPNHLVSLRRQGEVTVEQALTDYLELTLLDPAILNKLVRQYNYQAWSSRAEMQAYAQNRDIVDLLIAFPDLCELGVEFLALLSPLAPRYYSIASSPLAYPDEIHLLYKAIRFQREDRQRVGVTSDFMSQVRLGDLLQVEIKPNPHFRVPESLNTPIVMMAAGTGLAPFIGFMQQRIMEGAHSKNLLYFGETHRASRFLCQSMLEAWQQQGALDLLTVFSRDQVHKSYVQDLLLQNQSWLELWQAGATLYVCGDKTGLAKGIEQAIKLVWCKQYNWEIEAADQAWLEAKQLKRIQLDVY
ncbi:NADP oxidoreductase [Thiomicrospira microaerophila]|uniref:NADP oxidoreductase n=1 Tax=Thiomicrospira microaerophila TaxID=406020 RepID=UPI00200DA6BC|nr:NADP oxidoreductase [Thiomicrospira microaerophila]UQB42535.1 NADP oxidoreductase [Thiomicrospira microaerophila]